jgi:hypothetical protein
MLAANWFNISATPNTRETVMSNDQSNSNDPLGFVRNMWGNMGFSLPGMVAPTFDTEEIEKRIQDLKAVEGWLRMNLSMLQMTIQGLEMQTTTISAVKAMGNMAANAAQQVAQEARENHAAQTAAAAAAAPQPQTPEAEANTGDALSQAAMWPWNLMQQMQEHLQEQAAAAKAAKPAKAAPKKPAAKTAGAAAKRPARKS